MAGSIVPGRPLRAIRPGHARRRPRLWCQYAAGAVPGGTRSDNQCNLAGMSPPAGHAGCTDTRAIHRPRVSPATLPSGDCRRPAVRTYRGLVDALGGPTKLRPRADHLRGQLRGNAAFEAPRSPAPLWRPAKRSPRTCLGRVTGSLVLAAYRSVPAGGPGCAANPRPGPYRTGTPGPKAGPVY
jgi:hypothetical protein